MVKVKCPLFKYGRGSIINCIYKGKIKTDYGTKEKYMEQRELYCDTMKYTKCPFYKELVKD